MFSYLLINYSNGMKKAKTFEIESWGYKQGFGKQFLIRDYE